jgi:hypothetical protein
VRALLGVLLIVLCAAAGSQSVAQSAGAQPPAALTVKGGVEREMRLSLDELKKLPSRANHDVRAVRDAAAPAPAQETTRHLVGCLIRDVLIVRGSSKRANSICGEAW